MKKPSILLVSFTFLLATAWSQNITNKRVSITGSVATDHTSTSTDLPFFTSANDAEKIVTSIMGVLGLESNFKIKVANVPNVEADIRHHQRYILYNPQFINLVNNTTKDKWASIFILAHEVGHHLEGHTVLGINSRPEIELEADEFAGFILCKMGASLDQAQLAMHYIAEMKASKTHPGRIDRLAAIEKGWNKAEAQLKNTASVNKIPENINTSSQN